jgi:hypothetical protein
MVSELAVLFGGSPIPVLSVGGGSQEIGDESFESLQRQAYELLDQPLDYLGWVRAMQFATAQGDESEPMMPSSLYRLMASRIFPEGVIKDHSALSVSTRSESVEDVDSQASA